MDGARDQPLTGSQGLVQALGSGAITVFTWRVFRPRRRWRWLVLSFRRISMLTPCQR